MAEFYVAVEALIEKNGKYLMVEEGKDHVHGKWATPGGGAEYGENPIEAIKREIKEETGLEADVVGLIAVLTGEADYDDHPVFDFVFKAEVGEGEPQPVFDQEVLSAEFKSKKRSRNLI